MRLPWLHPLPKNPLFWALLFACIALCADPAYAQEPELLSRPGRVNWGAVLFTLPFLLFFGYVLLRWGTPEGGGAAFLCDHCKYNDVRYCARPERPNATQCPDFKQR